MFRIGDYSITKKLTWMNMSVSGAALLLACVAFAAYGLNTYQENLVRSLSIQAQMVESNSVSALMFNDPQSAEGTLSALKAAPNILNARIYTPDGRVFARYGATHSAASPPSLPEGQTEAHWFKDGQVILVRSIVFQGKPRGLVYIQSDLKEIDDRLKRYGVIAAIVLAVSMMAALLVSSVFQRRVAEPIVRLAETARIVSREKNYSVRAAPTGDKGEIAVLIEAFNEMLAQIQERETALHKAQENLNLALKSSGVGTWSRDLISGVVTWDDYMHPLFGLMPGAFSGKNEELMNRIHPEDREQVADRIAGALERFESEFRVIWPDGSVHDLAIRGRVYRDEAGKPVRRAGACWEVTERKKAEQEVHRLNAELEQRVEQRTAELAATNKDLEAFTYSVAHDLRAPLRHIQGFSKALLEDHAPKMESEATEYIRDIVDSTQHMGNLIDDLLSLARVGRQELSLHVTGLNTLIDEVLRDLKREMNGRDIRIQVGDLPFAECDPGLMKQVFYNLLSNAVKYTRPRKPALIEAGQMPVNGQPVIFIRDNGVGFNMKHAGKLFGVFQRLHRREDFEGTGVGLATVQRIIHKHGGHIWVEAEIDKGATFFFSLAAPQKS